MLHRGQGYYEHNEYERALSVWRHLDPDRDSLDPLGRVRYFYLRGMTDFRLGYPGDARYWLGLAKASLSRARQALEDDELARLDETLAALNRPVFGLAPAAPGDGRQVLGDACRWTSECESGFVCQEGVCVQGESKRAPAADAPPGAQSSEPPPSEPASPGL
jgi:hypothetical protein